jgi:hypothetical protein
MKSTAALCLLAFTLHAEDWAQFRGPNASGISSSKNLPQEFSADKNIAWKARLGDGVGSAIIKDGIVYTSGMAGDSKAAMHAFDAATGAAKWRTEFETGTLPRITPPNSHARDGWRACLHPLQHHRPAGV